MTESAGTSRTARGIAPSKSSPASTFSGSALTKAPISRNASRISEMPSARLGRDSAATIKDWILHTTNIRSFGRMARAADADGDPLTYTWEQRDSSGTPRAIGSPDNGTGPICRFRPPTADPTRTVPPLANLRSNTVNNTDLVPAVGRIMNWRLTAQDNRPGGGGLNTDDVRLTVVNTAGPFAITSPNTAVTWSGARTITWTVNNTNIAPINCATVDILLSTDGGNTFPTLLASGVPNNGSASIIVPSVNASQARIMVRSVGNIFFDISNVNFTIQPVPEGVVLNGNGLNTFTDNTGNGNANGFIDPGETDLRVTVGIVNGGNQTGTSIIGTLSSLTPTAVVTSASAPYPDLTATGATTNSAPFVLSVSASHPCGSPINLRLALDSAQSVPVNYDFALSTGQGGSPATQTFTYSGPAVAIPDGIPGGVNIPFTVVGVANPISTLAFRINGTTCSASDTSTTVGINHAWVGDLILRLTSPSGTAVVIMNQPGGGGNSGNNFCNTLLQDGAANSIQTITVGQNPYTGTFSPANPLAAFSGQSANGVWTLNVTDVFNADSGSVRNFSILVTSPNPPVCTPPSGCGCIADTDCDSDADSDDVIAFFTAWESAESLGDTDGDGDTDSDDVIVFFAAFEAGC